MKQACLIWLMLTGWLLTACSALPQQSNTSVIEYELSEKAVCLYPHDSWLPAFYSQYGGLTTRSATAADQGCADRHGSFTCRITAPGKCTLTYSEYGEQKQETFSCFASNNAFHCYDGGQYQHEYLVCGLGAQDNTLVCSKGEQFFADSQPKPSPPWFNYSSLAKTIEHFTQQSIDNAGLTNEIHILSVTATPGEPAVVELEGSDAALLENFAVMHQRFMDTAHGQQGLQGVKACQNNAGCWEPYIGNAPWAFYLPLGLAMLNQKIVNYLNYPPYDALTSGDYLDNFTMDRWNRILKSAGIANPHLYNTIVDSRPIAAPGSGQSPFLPDIMTYFNNSASGGNYVAPMINLLADPPGNRSTGHTLPVMVLGSDARKAWAAITGQPVRYELPYAGTTTLPGARKTTSWVATNHPDVTTYQCCPGDPSPSCQSSGYKSFDLVKDEQIDMQAICIAQLLSDSPGMDTDAAQKSCADTWVNHPSEANLRTLCINAKMDYNFTSTGRCEEKVAGKTVPSRSKADKFCAFYQNNACPAGVYSCEIP